MSNKLKSLAILVFAGLQLSSSSAKADEGMWLPMLISRLNMEDMQKKGLKLTADEIYSVNNASLKDAIVSFGGFCTGEIISSEGLVLTNHHCGFGNIQALSTPADNILVNGFWAKTKKDERPSQGLFVNILQRMEDVSDKVLEGITLKTPEAERSAKIKSVIDKLIAENKKESYQEVIVREMFDGNAYYLFVYNTYKDIRLVGTPPESIGKFGGDTDNWMWPRHTADFSLFRIYAAADGTPAAYSESNIPFKPKHFLPISLKGIKENDFAMVMGFPGRTNRYLSSFGVDFAVQSANPLVVKLRDARLSTWLADMNKDPKVDLQYASKYARIANYWKYFQGQTEQLQRLKVADLKRAEEKAFRDWVAADASRQSLYGDPLATLEKNFASQKEFVKPVTYYGECAMAVEIIANSMALGMMEKALIAKEDVSKFTGMMTKNISGIYKDYNRPTDQKLFAVMMQRYAEDVPANQQPEYFKAQVKKYKNNFEKWAADLFNKSMLADQAKFEAFLKNPSLKALQSDPAFLLSKSFADAIKPLREKSESLASDSRVANRLYMAGLLEMKKDKKFYPNANSTLRLTYGSVLPYKAKDAVNYHYLTTEKGILQKEKPGDREFDLPANMKQLLVNKDFGQYGENGKLPINFLSNNDITGGNSGSPVINAEGHLIGTAFDGNWEAMSGDISFEHQVQRTISLDIRYTLFIIDKLSGASHLVDEMKIIR